MEKILIRTRKVTGIILVMIMMIACNIRVGAENEKNATFIAMENSNTAISVNAENVCMNGNLATDGIVDFSENAHVNGEIMGKDHCDIFGVDFQYAESYFESVYIEKSDINCDEQVINYDKIAIISEYGNIHISSFNVSLSGVIYAPFGKVTIVGENINLNGVVIVADKIVIEGRNVNINSNPVYYEYLQNNSCIIDIPFEDYQYLKDKNANGIKDLFEECSKWNYISDTDMDGIPNIIEEVQGLNSEKKDSDGDGLDDYCEIFITYTDPSHRDSDNNNIWDGQEDFDEDGLTNCEEIIRGFDPYFCEDSSKLLVKTEIDIDENFEQNDLLVNFDEESNIMLMSLGDEIYYRSMSIREFKKETEYIEDDVEDYFSSYEVMSQKRTSDESSAFITAWNNMAATGRHYTLCVINCHGDNDSMYNGIWERDINALKRVDCEVVILLGCNCGHADYIWENVACLLSDKVTGVVVASDGTVQSSWTNVFGFEQKFKSVADDEFDEQCENGERDNYGWVIYEYNKSGKYHTWYTTNLKTITIEKILNHLDKSGLAEF